MCEKLVPFTGKIRRMLTSIALIVFLSYLGVCTLFYVIQDSLVFAPSREMETTPASNAWAFEAVRVPVDGFETCGWFVPASAGSRGTVLLSHGNAGNISGRLIEVQIFRDLRFDTLIYDYGGYGESTGTPSEARCYADARAMYAWLREVKHVPPERILLFGRSLGGGPTCQLATEVESRAVILESSFRSIPAMGHEVLPFLPVRLLARTRFDNESKIGRIRVPILVAHSPGDTIIPFGHGHVLFEAANEPKAFLEFRGDHNEGFWLGGEVYTGGIDTFLREHFDRDNQSV